MADDDTPKNPYEAPVVGTDEAGNLEISQPSKASDVAAGLPTSTGPDWKSWKTYIRPLAVASSIYGGARVSGADPLTAGAAGILGGMGQIPGPQQQVMKWLMLPFTGNRQPQQRTLPGAPSGAQQLGNSPTPYMQRGAKPGQTLDQGTANPQGSTVASLYPQAQRPPAVGQQQVYDPTGILTQPLAANGLIPTPIKPPWSMYYQGNQPVQQQGIPMAQGGEVKGYQLGGLMGSGALDVLAAIGLGKSIFGGFPNQQSQPGQRPGGLAGGGLPKLGRMAGIPNPSKGLHLKNPIGMGGMGGASSVNPMRLLARSLNPLRTMNPMRTQSLGNPRMKLLAQGGSVANDNSINDVRSDWFYQNMATRNVPKQANGLLRDVADKSNQNVKLNLPKETKMSKKQGYQHGGPIRGRMSEALGGPKVPGSNAESPLPSGKKAPMKFAKGGGIGCKKMAKGGAVRGAGCVVTGVRPAKKY